MNPFLQAKSFGTEARDRQRFAGRDQETEALVQLLLGSRIVLVHGPSGCGKTSLVHAALIPAMENRKFIVPPDGAIRPSAVAHASKEQAGMSVEHAIAQEFMRKLYPDFSIDDQVPGAEQLGSLVRGKQGEAASRAPVLLIIDQTEELFTHEATSRKWRLDFVAALKRIVSDRGVWLLLVMREEYVARAFNLMRGDIDFLHASFGLSGLTSESATESILTILDWATRVDDSSDVAEVPGVSDATKATIVMLVEKLREAASGIDSVSADRTANFFEDSKIDPLYLQIVCYQWWQQRAQSNQLQPAEGFDELFAKAENRFIDGCFKELNDSSAQLAAYPIGAEARARVWCECNLVRNNGRVQARAEKLGDHATEVLARTHLIQLVPVGREKRVELVHDRIAPKLGDNNKVWFEGRPTAEQAYWRNELWRMSEKSDALLMPFLSALGAARAWRWLDAKTREYVGESLLQKAVLTLALAFVLAIFVWLRNADAERTLRLHKAADDIVVAVEARGSDTPWEGTANGWALWNSLDTVANPSVRGGQTYAQAVSEGAIRTFTKLPIVVSEPFASTTNPQGIDRQAIPLVPVFYNWNFDPLMAKTGISRQSPQGFPSDSSTGLRADVAEPVDSASAVVLPFSYAVPQAGGDTPDAHLLQPFIHGELPSSARADMEPIKWGRRLAVNADTPQGELSMGLDLDEQGTLSAWQSDSPFPSACWQSPALWQKCDKLTWTHRLPTSPGSRLIVENLDETKGVGLFMLLEPGGEARRVRIMPTQSDWHLMPQTASGAGNPLAFVGDARWLGDPGSAAARDILRSVCLLLGNATPALDCAGSENAWKVHGIVRTFVKDEFVALAEHAAPGAEQTESQLVVLRTAAGKPFTVGWEVLDDDVAQQLRDDSVTALATPQISERLESAGPEVIYFGTNRGKIMGCKLKLSHPRTLRRSVAALFESRSETPSDGISSIGPCGELPGGSARVTSMALVEVIPRTDLSCSNAGRFDSCKRILATGFADGSLTLTLAGTARSLLPMLPNDEPPTLTRLRLATAARAQTQTAVRPDVRILNENVQNVVDPVTTPVTDRLANRITAHLGDVTALSWHASPELGQRLFSSGADGTTKMWVFAAPEASFSNVLAENENPDGLRAVSTVIANKGQIGDVVHLSDSSEAVSILQTPGHWLNAENSDGNVFRWRIDTSDLLRTACAIVSDLYGSQSEKPAGCDVPLTIGESDAPP
jgi:hypothetical protein